MLTGTSMDRVDLLLTGGLVVDGTGAPATRADVAIVDGRIAAIGNLDDYSASAVRLDAGGRVVCPGFVDAHGHSDIAVLSSPSMPSKVLQGVTTEIMGNCGVAVAPIGPETDLDALRAALALVNVDPSIEWTWRGVGQYLDAIAADRLAINVSLLAGHFPIRVSCIGYEDRPATDDELTAMQGMVDVAFEEGACGLSTGLMYPPASYADLRELVALGEVVARHDSVFSFHMRDYATNLLDAVAEVIAVARLSGARVQVSHLAVVGRPNWGKVSKAVAMIDAACEEGLDVAYDVYPYLAGSTALTQLLPDWSLEGGVAALLDRLANPGTRTLIHDEVTSTLLQEPEDVIVSFGTFSLDEPLVGASMRTLSERWGTTTAETMLRLVQGSGATVRIIAFGRSEDDLRAALSGSRCMIGSDGLGLDPTGPSGEGQPHPRSYGCYPRLMGRYVRDEGVLELEDAVRRSTSLVADRFGIRDRGRVEVGAIADLVVFDPQAINDRATFDDPHQFPTGIDAVLVRGRPVVLDGRLTAERPGAVLRGGPRG